MNIPELDFADDHEGICFFVPGIPAPGGSKRFVGIGKKTGRAILIDAAGARNKNWRASVAHMATIVAPKELLRGVVRVEMEFTLPRPKGHFRTGKRANELRPDAPIWHISKPDVLKLARSTEDALTGVIWADDSANAVLLASKRYGPKPGCLIRISAI